MTGAKGQTAHLLRGTAFRRQNLGHWLSTTRSLLQFRFQKSRGPLKGFRREKLQESGQNPSCSLASFGLLLFTLVPGLQNHVCCFHFGPRPSQTTSAAFTVVPGPPKTRLLLSLWSRYLERRDLSLLVLRRARGVPSQTTSVAFTLVPGPPKSRLPERGVQKACCCSCFGLENMQNPLYFRRSPAQPRFNYTIVI